MAEKDKGIDKRLKLTITEVKERQPVGDKGAVKLTFMATEGESDKPFAYFTFSTRLFDTIEQGVGKTLDCDVNISTRDWTGDDGNVLTFTDRKVIQIYIDGQPIGGRRGNGWQDSPAKIASEEMRSKMHAAKDLWIAGMIDKDSPEVKKLRTWIMGEPTKSPEPKASQKPPDAPTAEESPFPEENMAETSDIPKTIQALYNWIASHGKKYGRTWFLDNFSYTEEELRDPERVKIAYYDVKEVTGWEK